MKKGGCSMLDENDVARYVRQAVGDYFTDLDGEEPSCAVYDMVINCVEKPVIETVLHHAGGNQTQAEEQLKKKKKKKKKKIQAHKIKS